MDQAWLTPMAIADLDHVTDPSEKARLFDIANKELAFPPRKTDDEGWVRDHEGRSAWRRGLSEAMAAKVGDDLTNGAEDEDYSCRACDYYLVYRLPRRSEHTEAGKRGLTIHRTIERVVHVTKMNAFLSQSGQLDP